MPPLSRHCLHLSQQAGGYVNIPKINKRQKLIHYNIELTSVQESARKGIERAFGVLQTCFAMVQRPAKLMEKDDLVMVIKICMIMHNMIIENKRGEGFGFD